MGAHPEQRAGGIHGGFGQQLAGKVEVGPRFHLAQRHSNRRHGCLAGGGQATELLHSSQVLLAPVEGAAGGPWLQGTVFGTAHRHYGGAEGGDQRDGPAAGLHLVDRRPEVSMRKSTKVGGEGLEVSDLDPVQADDVSDLEDDGMVLQVLREDGAPDNLCRMVCDLQVGAVV